MASLDILQPSPPGGKISASRSSRWRLAVLLLVHLVAAAHITHWLVTGRSITPVEPSEASAFSSAGIVNAGLVFFLVTILLTAVFGRFFCGWACHLVALQDLSSSLLRRFGIRPRPLRSRLLLVVPLLAFFVMFLWPAIQRLRTQGTLAASHYEWTTEHFWHTFPPWALALVTFFVCGFVAIYFLGAKGFCTYACPYGAIFGAVDRIAPFRIRVNDDCEGCGHCTAVCTSNVRVHQEVRDFGMVTDPGCMKCMDCVSVCPKDALSYGFGPLPMMLGGGQSQSENEAQDRASLPWSEEVVLGLGFVFGYLCLRNVYGLFPFLLSLGAAACVAFLTLIAWRLARRSRHQNLALHGISLRRGGRITNRGRLAAGLLTLLTLGLLHSGWMRWEMQRADRAFARLTPIIATVSSAASDPDLRAASLSAAAREAVERAQFHYARLDRFGLVTAVGPVPRSAWLHLLDGDLEAARRRAGLAIERRELPWQMHRLLGVLAADEGDWSEAAKHYANEFASRPDPQAAVRMALAQARAGDLHAAQTSLRAARSQLASHPDLSYNLGYLASLAGDSVAAERLYREALQLDADHIPAIENLGGTLAQSGRFEEAESYFRRSLELAPDDNETRYLLARVLIELGRTEDARSEVERILRESDREAETRALQQLLAELDG